MTTPHFCTSAYEYSSMAADLGWTAAEREANWSTWTRDSGYAGPPNRWSQVEAPPEPVRRRLYRVINPGESHTGPEWGLPRLAGVGFSIDDALLSSLTTAWMASSGRDSEVLKSAMTHVFLRLHGRLSISEDRYEALLDDIGQLLAAIAAGEVRPVGDWRWRHASEELASDVMGLTMSDGRSMVDFFARDYSAVYGLRMLVRAGDHRAAVVMMETLAKVVQDMPASVVVGVVEDEQVVVHPWVHEKTAVAKLTARWSA